MGGAYLEADSNVIAFAFPARSVFFYSEPNFTHPEQSLPVQQCPDLASLPLLVGSTFKVLCTELVLSKL